MDAESGLWQSFSCEAQLPYVCEKPLNNTVELADTRCDAGWLPNNGFCYLLVNESDSWDNAQKKCRAFGTDLISIHSLADIEVVVTKLHNGDVKEETWIGLKNINVPALFQWSDGTEVTLTYWDENEPNLPYNKTPNCVSYLGKGWKRHGEACYKIYKDAVPFGTNCNLTITSRFEQEYLNDMMKKYDKSLGKYFWTGLADADSRGEYSWATVGGTKQAVTFSNWNLLEPASPGGCVAMSTGKSLGKWEVKDCRSFRALSICKKISGPLKPEEVAPKPDSPCPEGWHTFPSSLSCYKVIHRPWRRGWHFHDDREYSYFRPFACDTKLEWVCQIPKDINKPADCSTKLPFICEKYNVSSLEKYSPDSAAKVQCSGSWIPFQNKCFLKITPKSLTFSQASDTCHSYGGTLPSVLSQSEQEFEGTQTLQNTSETVKYGNNLYKIIPKALTWQDALRECLKDNMHLVSITDPYQQAFLTVQAVRHNSSLWIGLSSLDDERNFGWSDGKRLRFSRWADNQQVEDCVILDTDGFWKTADCSDNQPGAICYYPGRADMISIHNEEENAFLLDTLKKRWKGPDDILLGMFYDTDNANFKWFDNSNMTFDKWTDQEDDEDLVDTCAFLHIKTGEWKKGNCEVSSVEGTLCKTAIPYEKKYLSDNHILIAALVIASMVILTVLGAIIWFLYKRNSESGFATVFSTAPQSPYDDDCVLVVAEENDYAVQFN
ncbi:Lymphocyte antigen 75 [Tupaia chinensis]|uniref:Lymphocyte antigen 75 n=1 Tax=Tupaia chinensis TaxID=246437 RepID=L9J9V5_TUPCH|nr:Lymphocyte antigen 75 [Tupaia chinensis]